MPFRLPSLATIKHVVHPARHWLAGAALFLLALALRTRFRCGFVLGDDVEEFAMLRHILNTGPDWHNQIVLRFGVWLFTFISSRLFGLSETTFFLPTLLLSSSLSAIAYCIFVAHGHSVRRAFLQSLMVVTAPFEVLMGVVHSNDLFLTWCLAVGYLALIRFESRPMVQGITLGLLLWFGFYIKLWVVYLFPALALYFAGCFLRKRSPHGAAAFAATSAVLHGTTSVIWKLQLGTFVPFLRTHAATYPVDYRDLPDLFLTYPRQLFVGSEFGTTLFGVVPYILIFLLAGKVCMFFWVRKRGPECDSGLARWDRLDLSLLALYGSFFLLLNFFPNTFVFDRYYSAPRIFRYLTPVSFFMTVHAGKMLVDLYLDLSIRNPGLIRLARPEALVFGACVLFLNVAQARE
ncbi:MAG TPA: glycosyltransferase family 39 protein, partial [Polyangia bacterium]|nr:glycosyltransferase family 39 protein [Polyangia bacterium]